MGMAENLENVKRDMFGLINENVRLKFMLRMIVKAARYEDYPDVNDLRRAVLWTAGEDIYD